MMSGGSLLLCVATAIIMSREVTAASRETDKSLLLSKRVHFIPPPCPPKLGREEKVKGGRVRGTSVSP